MDSDSSPPTATGWIYAKNVQPFVWTFASLIGCKLDPEDLSAIRLALPETDAESDRWFEYALAGSNSAEIALAIDPGTDVLHFRIELPEEFRPRVETAVEIFSRYRVEEPVN